MPPNCANKETSSMVILFDLEGTLIQSIENDQKATLEVRIKTKEKLAQLGIPPSKLEDIRSFTLVRNKALDYVEEHFNERDAKRFHLEMDRFQKSYELRFANRSKIFQDTLPALRKLKNAWIQYGTSNQYLKRGSKSYVFSKYGIGAFFEVVVTREDVKRLKPDPGGILLVLERLNAQDFVFVGDLVHDSRAAENAVGVSIIVKRTPSKKLTFQANYVVRSLQEIPDLILLLKANKKPHLSQNS